MKCRSLTLLFLGYAFYPLGDQCRSRSAVPSDPDLHCFILDSLGYSDHEANSEESRSDGKDVPDVLDAQ
jgi:hypothetical protein